MDIILIWYNWVCNILYIYNFIRKKTRVYTLLKIDPYVFEVLRSSNILTFTKYLPFI
jgi:hypothetical protein